MSCTSHVYPCASVHLHQYNLGKPKMYQQTVQGTAQHVSFRWSIAIVVLLGQGMPLEA